MSLCMGRNLAYRGNVTLGNEIGNKCVNITTLCGYAND